MSERGRSRSGHVGAAPERSAFRRDARAPSGNRSLQGLASVWQTRVSMLMSVLAPRLWEARKAFQMF